MTTFFRSLTCCGYLWLVGCSSADYGQGDAADNFGSGDTFATAVPGSSQGSALAGDATSVGTVGTAGDPPQPSTPTLDGPSAPADGASAGNAVPEGDSTTPTSDNPPNAPSETEESCPSGQLTDNDGPTNTVLVDAQLVVGNIRSLQGAHWDPGPANRPLSAIYKELGVDMIRTHDAGGINGSGSGDVDGPGRDRMFPNLNADPSDPASYNFGPTDALIENIRAAGAEVFFRVGRSNIGFSNSVPSDFDHYAEVAKHIVMHYNHGWANGFEYGIRYFEIWNEPDFLPFWDGTGPEYFELYRKVARAIKEVDPEALVGGPALSTFNDKMGLRKTFMTYLRENQVPLDFYSFHKYTNKSNDPLDFARMAQSFRDELDEYGFNETQIMNSEWESSLQGDPILGGEAGRAAFTAESLIYMQDAPVAKAMSYMMINARGSKESLAFGAVSRLKATPSRLCAQGGNDEGFAVIAGLSESEPALQVVVANYQVAASLMGPIPGGNEEEIDVPGLGHLASMTYLDRRSFTYPDKDGYTMTITAIPDSWGEVTVRQFRIDAGNDFELVNTLVSSAAERPNGTLEVTGSWARARANPPEDPKGAAQGVDLIIVTGEGADGFDR